MSLMVIYKLDLMTYSEEEIRQATNSLNSDHLLGSGAFGDVYWSKLRHTDVAIKVLKGVNYSHCTESCL